MTARGWAVVAAALAPAALAAPPEGYLGQATVKLGTTATGIPRAHPGRPRGPRPPGTGAAPLPTLSSIGRWPLPAAAGPSGAGPPDTAAAPLMEGELVDRLRAYLARVFQVSGGLSVRAGRIVSGPGTRVAIDRIDVAFGRGRLDSVPVQDVRMAFYQVALDGMALRERGEVRLKSRAPADVLLTITQEGLNEVLRARQRSLRIESPRMKLSGGRITFSGRLRHVLGSHLVTTTGEVRLAPGGEVTYHPKRLAFGAVELPGVLQSLIERKVNPIIDLTRIGPLAGVEVRLAALEVRNEGLVLATEGARAWDFHLGAAADDERR